MRFDHNKLCADAHAYEEAGIKLRIAMNAAFPRGTKVMIQGHIRGVIHCVAEDDPTSLGAKLEHGHVRWFDVSEVVPDETGGAP